MALCHPHVCLGGRGGGGGHGGGAGLLAARVTSNCSKCDCSKQDCFDPCLDRAGFDAFNSLSSAHPMSCQPHDMGCTEPKQSSHTSLFGTCQRRRLHGAISASCESLPIFFILINSRLNNKIINQIRLFNFTCPAGPVYPLTSAFGSS